MKKTFVVNVPEEELTVLERAWYEYNGSRDIIAYLMSQPAVRWEALQEYINVSEQKFTKCEMEKIRIATMFKPEEVDLSKYNFNFDFQENTITFEEA